MPVYTIRDTHCEIDYDRGQEEGEISTINLGKTSKSNVSLEIKLDSNDRIVRLKIKHPSEN